MYQSAFQENLTPWTSDASPAFLGRTSSMGSMPVGKGRRSGLTPKAEVISRPSKSLLLRATKPAESTLRLSNWSFT
jgi:hypothetical protein